MKKRGFGKGKWNGVGGKLEPGETVEDALIRETQEEIGVTPIEYRAVGELDFVQDVEDNPWHMYVYAYIATKWDGEPTESEEMAPRWYEISNMPYADMWDDDMYWVPQVLAGKLVRGEFEFDGNDRMISHNVKEVGVL